MITSREGFVLVLAVACAAPNRLQAQNSQQAAQQAAQQAQQREREEAERQRRAQEVASNRRTLLALDPSQLSTTRLRRLRPVACHLVSPEEEEGGAPFGCTRLLDGPAVLLSGTQWDRRKAFGGPDPFELAAFARGGTLANERLRWWTKWDGLVPLVIAADEIVYLVGEVEVAVNGPNATITFYKP